MGWFCSQGKEDGAFTALDAMKLFAIFNMTADHMGAYFFPDDLWWRAVGASHSRCGFSS